MKKTFVAAAAAAKNAKMFINIQILLQQLLWLQLYMNYSSLKFLLLDMRCLLILAWIQKCQGKASRESSTGRYAT